MTNCDKDYTARHLVEAGVDWVSGVRSTRPVGGQPIAENSLSSKASVILVSRIAAGVLAAVAVVLAIGPAPGANPPTLAERAAAIENVVTQPDGARVVIGHISRKLRLPTDTLRAERAQTGLGWGELLIANLISSMGKLRFEDVAAEFQKGKSLEAIARDYKVNAQQLTAEVSQSQEIVEQREEDRAPATSSGSGSKPHGSAARQPGGDTHAGAGRGRRVSP